MLKSVLLSSLLYLTTFIEARAIGSNALMRRGEFDNNQCKSFTTDFAAAGAITDDWRMITYSSEENCFVNQEGLVMRIVAPSSYEKKIDVAENAFYNTVAGKGCTLNSTSYMHYGRFSAVIKASEAAGAVTAVILIADNNDEIDYELLNKENQITSNYFYGKKIVYGENGEETNGSNGNVYDTFYNYTVVWTPESIQWIIDGNLIRTKNYVKEYPTNPARLQIGLWDGSDKAGTARWAGGPIQWAEKGLKQTDAIVKSVEFVCDDRYNNQ